MKTAKCFRLDDRSMRCIKRLSEKYNLSETSVVETAVKFLASLDATPEDYNGGLISIEQMKIAWL